MPLIREEPISAIEQRTNCRQKKGGVILRVTHSPVKIFVKR